MKSASEVREDHTFTVLLVEDEALLRAVVRETLRQAGFEVVEAEDGAAALDILRSDRAVDVLLTDVKMPGINGYQLAEASMKLRPSVGVMLMTGYSDEAMPDLLREAHVPTLRKPFDFDSLARTVREVLPAH